MKKLNLLGVFALTIAMLASGCHRKPIQNTPIPGMTPPPGQESGPTSGVPVPTEPPVQANTTGYPEGGNGKYTDVLEHGTANREKFAADTVYFDFDRATVRSSEESKLQDVANYFKNNNNNEALVVEGNCDERGTEKYNLSLGERRALAIREYLVNLGMDPQRIKTVTYGASKPVDPGHDEAAWKKNRRGDLILMTK